MQILLDACPVCGATPVDLSSVHSEFSAIDFQLRRCRECGLSFVANPRVDFGNLYDSEYYAGRGADSLVDYLREIDNPRTVREYEWRGIFRAVTSIAGSADLKWLDYGCGLGGLVRSLRERGVTEAYGFDEGWSAQWLLDHGLPLLGRDELESRRGTFDVVTAIEVIEHVSDPLAVMSLVSSLLKPGGLSSSPRATPSPIATSSPAGAMWRHTRPGGVAPSGRLHGFQGRGGRDDRDTRPGARRRRDPGQRHRPRCCRHLVHRRNCVDRT